MKISKEKRDRLILVGIMTVAVSAAVWQLFILASRSKLVKAHELGTRAKEKYEKAERFLKMAPSLEAEAEALSKRIARIEEQAMANPTDPFSWSLQLIEKARQNHDVGILEVTPPKSPGPVQLIPDFPYQSVSFNVRGIAYYQDLGKFLADFENAYPYCLTRNLQITSARQLDTEAAKVVSGDTQDKVLFRMDVVALLRRSASP